MTGHLMTRLSEAEMVALEGGGFWQGFLCGAGVVGTIAAFLSPEPLGKVALWTIASGTVAACGAAL